MNVINKTQQGETIMKLVNYGIIFSALMLGSTLAQADSANGKQLAAKNCTRCHDSSVYTRPNRQVRSLDALHKRVNMCEKPASVNWSAKDLNDVVEYLNKDFYHFK